MSGFTLIPWYTLSCPYDVKRRQWNLLFSDRLIRHANLAWTFIKAEDLEIIFSHLMVLTRLSRLGINEYFQDVRGSVADLNTFEDLRLVLRRTRPVKDSEIWLQINWRPKMVVGIVCIGYYAIQHSNSEPFRSTFPWCFLACFASGNKIIEQEATSVGHDASLIGSNDN